MRIFLFLICLLLIGKVYPNPTVEVLESPDWSIVKNSPLFSFSAEFDCKQGDRIQEKIIRTGLFCPRYFYDLYEPGNVLRARGITRIFSWGFFFPWGMEIDVYDPEEVIGKIEGKLWTKARAKFSFYDPFGRETATAYLDTKSADFIIVSPEDESIVADLKGKAFGDLSIWEMHFARSPKMDPRILKVFAAFVADYHNEFFPPPEVVHHFYVYPYYENNHQ